MGNNRKSNNREVKLSWERIPTPDSPPPRLVVAEEYGDKNEPTDFFVHGDNLHVMRSLLKDYSESIDLIYIDPPYATGRVFSSRTRKRKGDRAPQNADAFDDRWDGGLADYLDMLAPRLELMRELLSPEGSIYVHVDWRAGHYVKILMDEIFGRDMFQNEIAWCYREAINSKKRWNRKHDLIFFYSKSKNFTFNYEEVLEEHSESTIKKYRLEDNKGPYRLMGRGIQGSPIRSARDVAQHWEDEHPELTYRHYLPAGRLPVDYWNIDIVNQAANERTGYATQKPESLIERIIRASSNDGDLVADFFCGSGAVPAVARRLGRKWIACDASSASLGVTRKRLLQQEGTPPAFVVMRPAGNVRQSGDLKPHFEISDKSKNAISILLHPGGDTGDIAMWAVDTNYDGKIFRPCWWSCRTKREQVTLESASLKKTSKEPKCAVLVSDVNGGEYLLQTDL